MLSVTSEPIVNVYVDLKFNGVPQTCHYTAYKKDVLMRSNEELIEPARQFVASMTRKIPGTSIELPEPILTDFTVRYEDAVS